MAPITTAIVAAAAGVSSSAIKDSYEALKSAIKKKFGEKSDLIDAIDKLEKNPDREDRQATVKAEVEIAKANDALDILKLAQDLLDKIKGQSGGQLKALDEQLFLGDINAAIQSYLKAAEWASYYTDETSLGVVANSRGTAAFLVRNPASKLAQFNAWSLVLTTARDNETRQRAIAEIEKIGGKVTFNGTAASVSLPNEIIEEEKKALGIQ
jgi:hypothetical protein